MKMKKIIVSDPEVGNRIIEVSEFGGKYHDLSKVIWDERLDGKIPKIIVGRERWAKRDISNPKNPNLIEDLSLKTLVQNDDSTKAAAIATVKTNKEDRISDFSRYNGDDLGSGAMLLKLLEHLDLK